MSGWKTRIVMGGRPSREFRPHREVEIDCLSLFSLGNPEMDSDIVRHSSLRIFVKQTQAQ